MICRFRAKHKESIEVTFIDRIWPKICEKVNNEPSEFHIQISVLKSIFYKKVAKNSELYEICKKLANAFTKHSFLRELREVAPEMELFPGNHSPYEKDFVTKSNPYAKFSARHFTKKFVSWRICQESGSPHFFDGNSLPNTTLVEMCILCFYTL